MANTRYVTLLTKQSNQPSSTLPASAATGEALVNTADGKVYYKGFISGTGATTYLPSLANAAFFEVGSHVSQIKVDDKIVSYSGVTNLTGLFLSGTSTGFALAPISNIITSDTYLTGGTFNNASRVLTLTLNNATNVVVTGFTDTYVTGGSFTNNVLTLTNSTGGTFTVYLNSFSGLTVNGNLNVTGATQSSSVSATTITAGTLYGGIISATTISGGTLYGNGSNLTGVATANTFTTASTYNQNTGTISFTRNDGQSYTAGTWNYVSAATLNQNVLSTTSNGGVAATTTINAATGGTFNSSTGTLLLSGTGVLASIAGFNSLTAATLYTLDGTLQSNRTVNLSSFTLNFSSATAPNALFLSGSNVGIGIAPIYKLDVNGGARVSNGVMSTGQFGGPFSDGIVMDYVNAGGRISVGSGDSITFYTNYPSVTGATSAMTMVITSAGTVGIGTTAATNALTVSATTNPVQFIGLQTATDIRYVTSDATGVLHYRSDVLTGNTALSSVTLSQNILSTSFNGGAVTATTINAATGGTYNAGTITLTGSGVFSTITGLTSANTFTTASTYNAALGVLSFTRNDGSTYSANTWTYTSAATLSQNVLSVVGNGGSAVNTTINAATGGTFNGATGVITLAGTGTLSTITGLPIASSSITAFTYNNANILTLTNNTGGTLSALFNIFTGFTVNGNTTVTGNTFVSGATINTGNITAASLFTSPTGQAIVGTGGLVVGSGGSEGTPGTGDVIINGSLTVFGSSVSAFTSNLYSEDQNITLNYNPTGSTYATSLTGGFTVQNGLGVSGLTGDSIFFQIAQTGTPISQPDAYAKRFWETQLGNIMIGSTGGTGTGNYVLQAQDILNGGSY